MLAIGKTWLHLFTLVPLKIVLRRTVLHYRWSIGSMCQRFMEIFSRMCQSKLSEGKRSSLCSQPLGRGVVTAIRFSQLSLASSWREFCLKFSSRGVTIFRHRENSKINLKCAGWDAQFYPVLEWGDKNPENGFYWSAVYKSAHWLQNFSDPPSMQ